MAQNAYSIYAGKINMNCGAGIFLVCPKTGRILLARRSPTGEHEPNTWCSFGGMVEENEDVLEAAKREVFEEAKISPSEYELYPEILFIDEKPDFTFFTYLGLIKNELFPEINHEHSQYKWLKLAQILDIDLHSGLQRLFLDQDATDKIKLVMRYK